MLLFINKLHLPVRYYFISIKKQVLFFYSIYGWKLIKLPSKFFFKSTLSCLSFKGSILQLNFVKLFNNIFTDLYFFKLRIKGLGYRLRTITINFHYIFFNYTNFFYVYVPFNILMKTYKKRLIVISYCWASLRLFICHLLLLQEIGPYKLYGLRWVKELVILKKSGKKI